MNETGKTRDISVKILVIIGFIATIALFVWLATVAIQKAFPAILNMASLAETKNNYKPVDELTITSDKEVVNVGESFRLTWTDMKQTGDFKFTYVCEDGVSVLVREESGKLVSMLCTETLTLPATAHGLFLSMESTRKRFADVEFSVAFVSSQKEITHISQEKVTVVNASPTEEAEEVAGESTDNEPEPVVPKPPVTTPQPTTPTFTTVYPESNPNGTIDLAVNIIGTGEVRNGIFYSLRELDADERSAIKFDIENIGTKTSGTWKFEITFPDGETFKSVTQPALKPQEHAVFTFELDLSDDDDSARFKVEVETTNDSKSSNNSDTWATDIDT